MPLYFFDIADANTAIPCQGAELSSLAEARCFALKYAGQVLCDQPASFWTDDEWVLTVSDEHHLTMFVIVISTLDAPAAGQPATRRVIDQMA